MHFKNVTITSNYKTSDYDSTFRAGLLFASSNHPTTFTNITIVNSTLNLNENTGFAIVGALIGLNWGY